MKHTVRDEHDHAPTLRTSPRAYSSVGLRSVPSSRFSGDLREVLMYTHGSCPSTLETHGSCPTTLEMSGGISEEKDPVPSKQSNLVENHIEWHNLMDGLNANASNLPPFSTSESDSRFQRLHQKSYMAPARPGTGSWDVDGRVVNYLQAFEPRRSDSGGCRVDRGQVEESGLTLDVQLLKNAASKGCDASDVPDREGEEFGADSPTVQSQMAGNNPGHHLFARGLGIPSPASMKQLNRSPNHAIRNLFPEQSSNFSAVLSQEDLGSKGTEHIHLSKKPRRQEYIETSLLSQADADLNHVAQYRKAFPHDQRSNSLVNLISTTPFPSSGPDRSTFNTTNMTLQNPSLSSFPTSGPPLSLKKNPNDSVSLKSSMDYSFSLDTRMQGGFSRCAPRVGLLVPEGNSFGPPLNLMDLPSPQSSQPTQLINRNYVQSGPVPGQLCQRRQSTMDSGGAWPAGYINFPSLSIDSGSGAGVAMLSSSRRSLHEFESGSGQSEDREGRGVHSISESKPRLVIQKQLTATDVGSLGRIILPKKEAETHLPHLPDKEGMEMCLYDYGAERTWVMKYRFWPNNKSRMYLLENTGEFSKYHGLQQGDLLLIYRDAAESPRYILRAKKMAPPLLHITPSQSVTESGGQAGDDLGPAASGTGSTASKEVCGTSASTCHQLSSDVPSSAFSQSGGAAASCSHHVVEAKSEPLMSKYQQQPSNNAAAEDHHQHHRLKNFMALQPAQQDPEMPAELDGEGVYNLEEFPRLIEAEEIIDNIFRMPLDRAPETDLKNGVAARTRPLEEVLHHDVAVDRLSRESM